MWKPYLSKFALFFCGVVLPVAAVAYELTTEACLANFSDPLPTPWHLLLVLTVPFFHTLQRSRPWSPGMQFCSGFVLTISGIYALLFLPGLAPALLWGIIFQVTLLAIAPMLALWATVRVVRRRGLTRTTAWGAAAALGALLVGAVPLAYTDYWMAHRDIPHLRQWGVRRHMLGACLQHYHCALDFPLLEGRRQISMDQAERLFEETWGTPAKTEPPPPILGYIQYIRGGGHLFHPLDARATPEPDLAILMLSATILGWRARKR
jgi:hypothetical protein